MAVAADPLDLSAPELVTDPYPTYAGLRAGGGPRYSEQWDVWLVPGYDHCRQVFSSALNRDSLGQPYLRMLQAEVRRGAGSWRVPEPPALAEGYGDQRAAGRRVNGRALSTEFVDSLWPAFAASCRESAAALAVRSGPVDLVGDYAKPVVTGLLAGLMGVSPQELPVFSAWVDSGYEQDLEEERRRVIATDIRRLFAQRAVDRVREPQDDFLGSLAANPIREDLKSHLESVLGAALMISMVPHQGLVLSFSTLANALLTRPDQYALLRKDGDLVPRAVEEGLRYDSSTQALGRLVRQETTIGGARVATGSLLVLMVGSANRDERQWPDAAAFDVTRDQRSAARHLGFGHGATSCLGAAMSRKALTYMLAALVEAVAEWAPAGSATAFPEFMTRGFTTLPAELRRS
ncbi:cytochrome P450 [Nonomuraea sp. NPDC046802]|uniref:cytochrome P450 n=1 Tax=Nonomuraea sp. NPDC046802 TaxID=3154919 RepID=UPI0033CC6E81